MSRGDYDPMTDPAFDGAPDEIRSLLATEPPVVTMADIEFARITARRAGIEWPAEEWRGVCPPIGAGSR